MHQSMERKLTPFFMAGFTLQPSQNMFPVFYAVRILLDRPVAKLFSDSTVLNFAIWAYHLP